MNSKVTLDAAERPGGECNVISERQKKSKREMVRCSNCGRIIAGKIPKGGDGSVLIPYRHTRYNTVAQMSEECPGTLAFGLPVIVGGE